MLTHAELLQLKRWNTPTIYNGWEQITKHDSAHEGVNLEEVRDFMPQMGPMVGYAVTLVVEPGNPKHKENANARGEYLKYVASIPGPKIAVVQDLDKPNVFGSFWGEVQSNTHRALGCVGTITDGAIRDLDEMTNAGLKSLARRTVRRPRPRYSGAMELRGRSLRTQNFARPADPRRQARIHRDSAGGRGAPPGSGCLHGQQRVQHGDPRGPGIGWPADRGNVAANG